MATGKRFRAELINLLIGKVFMALYTVEAAFR